MAPSSFGWNLHARAWSLVESTSVLPEGRITPEDLRIWFEPLFKVVEFAHSQNQKIGIQLAHAGRKASTVAPWITGNATAYAAVGGWPDNVWGPSAIPYEEEYPKPKELSKEGIKTIVSAFVDATKRAVKVGFDVIEIHSAHGYLLHSFLSPASNKRADEYGGSFENRIRLILEVVDGVRAAMPNDMPLFYRYEFGVMDSDTFSQHSSATDWLEESLPHEPSWRSEDTVKIAPILHSHGVDFLDVSTGGNHHAQKLRLGPAYQAPFAHAVKKSLDTSSKLVVSAVGPLIDGETAQRILDKGQADAVFVGRQF